MASFRVSFLAAVLLMLVRCPLTGQESASLTTNATPASKGEKMAVLQLEMTNAFSRVLAIVNQPVRAFKRTPQMKVSTHSPGWFHEGAIKPDFGHVDVRQTQELIYTKNPYVTSDLNPGVVFPGAELEFNAMTKYFYTNRSLPKRKLTEGEMLEINDLYRTIGRCERELRRLNPPSQTALAPDEATADAEEATAGGRGFIASFQSIPKSTRVLYGAGAIGAIVVVWLLARLMTRKRGIS